MRRSQSSTSTSPTSPVRPQQLNIPKCFRPPPKPAPRPIHELTVRELRDIYNRNQKILSSPGASTSTYVHRISAEQAAIESRLVELDGMETIQTGLKNTKIRGEDDMNVDPTPEPVISRTIEAKRKALSRFYNQVGPSSSSHLATLSLREAIELEQQAHARDRERRQQILERKQRMEMPQGEEFMTRKEKEARIWAFMNHKPTESDLEDDDDEYDSDENPATWFEDDQDDGRKGQDIVLPDAEDLTDIIRVDASMVAYSTFYEPQDDDD